MKQLLEALSYCHNNNISHKDLKPENILLENKKDIESIKLIDFGTAQKFEKNKKMTTIIGTPYYVAPEVLHGLYDEKCDIWGAGVIMFILLSGVPPFNGPDDDTIMKAVSKGEYEFKAAKWKGISTHAKDLIDKMLMLDPDERITAKDALDHKWFKNFKEGTINRKALSGALKDLKKFKSDQTMQQAVLSYIVSHMTTNKDTKLLEETFKKLDVNHDGKLSLEELLGGIKKIYPDMTDEDAEKLFKEADIDGNGGINYSEWIAATIDKKTILTDENLKSAFKLFDSDGSGSISLEEIKKILDKGKKLEEGVWDDVLNQVDVNGDGGIDFEEFKKMMKELITE